MQFLTILVATLLGACALIFVLYPIYERMRQSGNWQDNRGEQSNGKDRPYHTRNGNQNRSIVGVGLAPTLDGSPIQDGYSLDTAVNSQEEREQAARTALREVELDFQLGNLAEADYRSLRERYMRRALLAMKSRHDREQELDEAIEEQLRRLREADEANQPIEHNQHEI